MAPKVVRKFSKEEFPNGVSSIRYPRFLESGIDVFQKYKAGSIRYMLYTNRDHVPEQFDPREAVCNEIDSGDDFVVLGADVAPGIRFIAEFGRDDQNHELSLDSVRDSGYGDILDSFFEISFDDKGLSEQQIVVAIMLCEHFMSENPREYFIDRFEIKNERLIVVPRVEKK